MASFCSYPILPALGLVVFWDPYTLVLTLNQIIPLLAQTLFPPIALGFSSPHSMASTTAIALLIAEVMASFFLQAIKVQFSLPAQLVQAFIVPALPSLTQLGLYFKTMYLPPLIFLSPMRNPYSTPGMLHFRI